MTGDEIVITGISGKFPNSENVKIFQENILNMVDCITNDDPRWTLGNPKIPERTGKIKDVKKFDSIFFGTNPKIADSMDPMTRISMECAYEAIADSGNNPRQMKGKKCAVFVGYSISEREKMIWSGTGGDMSNFTLLAAAKNMISNRISFFLDINGPSITIDNLCLGSATALEEAYKLIKSNTVDSALVCGGNLALHPEVSLQFFDLGLLSPDGITRSFDDAANGHTRSEAVVVLYLQRARDAKRIYAEISGVHSMFGSLYDRNSVLHPTCNFQMKVMKMTLEDSGISGKDVSFVEADGMAVKDADAEEVEAINKVYNEGRTEPLLIGSVKSNVGSCSAANTVVAIAKVLTMMNSGSIPPNLYYKNPSKKIPAIRDGRIEVVTKPTPWKGNYIAINNTSIGGGCASVILKSYKKERKNDGQPDDDLPRLITVSGSNEEAVAALLEEVESRIVDVEMLQLLNNVFEEENPLHLYRGYSLLPSHGLVKSKIRDIQYSSGSKREVWYLFSGMGSQWAGMGDAFMMLPVFAEAVRKCDSVLKPHGINITQILTEKNPNVFDNIINSFVGIATCQIGLVDLLTYFGIKPDFMIGHSVGELGCAYADGCFTAEEMVLSALSRGMASVESNLPKGSMAAVGLGYEDVKSLCPHDIDVACHNSSESSTISGPAETIKQFVADLTAKSIFAKEVACSNIAFHSRYIAPAGVKLKEYLQKVIPNPRPRSVRWISTSFPRREWNSAKARLSSAEYHTNNLLNPVLFAETSRVIPANAVVIEIAPHGLLQAIVNKSLPEGVINVPLTKRGHPDNVKFMMAALGKIHNSGLNIKVSKLYPKVNYPVSCGTPSISPLIKWDHSKDWDACFYVKPIAFKEGEVKFKIDLNSDYWKFLKGNKIDNKLVLPYSLYLKLAWSVMQNLSEEMDQPTVFDNVVVHKIQNVTEDKVLELIVMVQRGSGSFEVTLDGTLLCSGVLRRTNSLVQEQIQISHKLEKSIEELNCTEVYNELQMRGFQYSGSFKSIHLANSNGSNGVLIAQKEWITFVEGMIQMYIFGSDLKATEIPLKAIKIIVDMKQYKEQSQHSKLIPVLVDQQVKLVRSGGIELQGISLMPIERDFFKGFMDIEEIKIVSATVSSIKTHSTPIVQKRREVANWRASRIHFDGLNLIDWIEDQSFDYLDKTKVVKIEYSVIDESDILLATEKMTSDVINRRKDTKQAILGLKNFGLEYSGINAKGTRVMGISGSGTLSSITIPDPELIWQVPKTWDLQEAATVPLTYAASYMALYLKAEIKRKESVFIYNGISALGQASINLALSEECKVFTTYATMEEKAFLKKRYPDINENHFFSSKGSFENDTLSATKGAGVDILIYNSSSLKKIESCLACVKSHARIIILGNLLKASCESVGMRIFVKEVVLYSVIPKNLLHADVTTKQKLVAMVKEGISRGIVTPLPSNLYSREALRQAFNDSVKRGSQNIVVKVQPENSTKGALAFSCFAFSNKRSYIIIDDLSKFGLELVNFLVSRGAKDIFIASAKKNLKTLFNYRKRIWQESGAQVILCEDFNYSVQDNVKDLLSEASKLNPIDVIFDLQQMKESSERTFSSKYLFTKNLVEESRKKCTNLRQFVFFSTSQYAEEKPSDILLRNIDLVKLCQERSGVGLPAIFILWGPIKEIVESKVSNEKKIPLLTIPQCVEQLEDLIGLNTPIVKASYSEPVISKSQQNATNNKAIQQKDEQTQFQEYLYTTEAAVGNKLINLVADVKMTD